MWYQQILSTTNRSCIRVRYDRQNNYGTIRIFLIFIRNHFRGQTYYLHAHVESFYLFMFGRVFISVSSDSQSITFAFCHHQGLLCMYCKSMKSHLKYPLSECVLSLFVYVSVYLVSDVCGFMCVCVFVITYFWGQHCIWFQQQGTSRSGEVPGPLIVSINFSSNCQNVWYSQCIL